MSSVVLLSAADAPVSCIEEPEELSCALSEGAERLAPMNRTHREVTIEEAELLSESVAMARGEIKVAEKLRIALVHGFRHSGLSERFYCLLALRLREAGLLQSGAKQCIPLERLLKQVGPWLLYGLALAESDRGDEQACYHWLQQIADDGSSRGWRTWQRFRNTARALGLSMYVFARQSREFWTSQAPSDSGSEQIDPALPGEPTTSSRRPREEAIMESLNSLLALPPEHERIAVSRLRILWKRLSTNGLHQALLCLSRFCREHEYPLRDKEWSMLLKLVRERGTLEQVEQAVDDVQHASRTPDAVLVQDLLCALRQLQRGPEASQLFESARQRGVPLSRYHYTSMIAMCADRGDADAAQRYYTQMEQAGIPADVLLQTTLMHAYGKAGRHEAAQELFDQQLEAKGVVDKALCGALIDVLGKAGLCGRSADVFSQMQSTGTQATVAEYGALLLSYSRSGDVQKAQALFDKMTKDGVRPSAAHHGALLKAYLRAGYPVRAEELRQTMRQRGIWVEPCVPRLLIHAYGKAGMARHAQRIFNEMLNSPRRPGSMEYGALIYAYSKSRQPSEAQRVFDSLGRCGLTPNQRHYGALLDAYAKVGQPALAEQIFDKMQAQGLPAGAIEYGALLSGYCKSGCLADAERIFAKMQHAGVRADLAHYTVLITAYRSTQHHQQADVLQLRMQEMLQAERLSVHHAAP